MKIAIISDTHLGDPMCSLVEKIGNTFRRGPKYAELINATGVNNDYLILLGDILDFSVTSYENAYNIGKAFFTWLQQDKITMEYIYIPGNHDYDVWSVVENEVNVIYQIKQGKLPRKFRMSVPCILDDRKKSKTKGLTLPGVEIRADGNYSYGGLFLDNITKNYDKKSNSSKGNDSHFIFAYPNLYMVTDSESLLITHGHYLESYWSLLSEWVPRIFRSDLKIGTAMDICELVGINFPFNQLACSGVGQAGKLTDILSALQFQIKRGDIEKAQEYINNLDNYLDDNVFVNKKWYQIINEGFTDLISNKVKNLIVDAIASQKSVRYNEQFLNIPDVKKRFLNYYDSSFIEIDDLMKLHSIDIPKPQRVIFGHTHEPVPWNYKDAPKALPSSGPVVRMYNTGGWLWREDGKQRVFTGAEVFKYDTIPGFSSVSIR